ncbi:hypothetical protein BC343_28815 [Mucilaginibacter pedocola]|uniref:Uncharacterized protein n=1 Tax=Mucilaginibacter pedocola TaxID=1792845 RepID=A0A1S9PDX3_9SPHI|nr:hypothetical protein BC343_28815 [Mucilaginibacter pedocola]
MMRGVRFKNCCQYSDGFQTYRYVLNSFVVRPLGELTHPADAIAGPPSLLRKEGFKIEAYPLFRRKRGSGSDSEPGVSKISRLMKLDNHSPLTTHHSL